MCLAWGGEDAVLIGGLERAVGFEGAREGGEDGAAERGEGVHFGEELEGGGGVRVGGVKSVKGRI